MGVERVTFACVDLPIGYVGLTDPDWHAFLASQAKVDEVNFWQPHGTRTFRAIPPRAPFFFKLRAPLRAIAGFGFFERYKALSARMAWEAFGPMNGAPTFEALLDRLRRLRQEETSRSGDFQIGCIMLSAPVFLPQESWVAPPKDWPRTGVQQGMRLDLLKGEGARVLRECMDRALVNASGWNVDRLAERPPRYGEPTEVRPRLGQGLFSFAVRDAYQNACAVTREHSMPVLEAAHIKPYALGGEHAVDNGMLLRADLHKLFDAGYVTVTPDFEFRVGERLRSEWKNGKTYYAMNGMRIALPAAGPSMPRRELLEWHSSQVFLG